MEEVVLTNMCLVTDGDRFLVQDRKDKGWSGVALPGGHIDPGESFVDSVIREVFEETGLTISSPKLCGIKWWPLGKKKRYLVFCYRANKFTGELNSSDEGEVYWVNKEDFTKLKLAKGMERMIRLFIEEDITEQEMIRADGDWICNLK